MTEIPNNLTAKEYQHFLKTGQLTVGKKGRIKQGILSPEFKRLLEKDKELQQQEQSAPVSKENRKIKGAIKCEWNSIKFDSKLERDFYQYLTVLNIPFKHQVTYELQEGFVMEGDKIRPITWTPDFDFGTFIIDTKGYDTQQVLIRVKMFKYKYRIPVYIFKNKTDFKKIHELIKTT